MSEEHKLEEVTHGLIALDPNTKQENGNMDIVHFCGYWSQPGKEAAEHLLEELASDEEFGLTEIAHRLLVIEAPQHIIDTYCKQDED